jgi:hypothetical protein
MILRELGCDGCEAGGGGSGSCVMVDFGISSFEPLGSTVLELDLCKNCF